MSNTPQINVETIDHIGIRVRDSERAIEFYSLFGFEVVGESSFDAVVILPNETGVEINLVVNANNPEGDHNILMDVETKYPGHTHIALRVPSIPDTIRALEAGGITITQGPVEFSNDGHVSVFVRDPDRNTLELRARHENLDEIEGLTRYDPNG